MKNQFMRTAAHWRFAVFALLWGCAASGELYGETVGEHFRRVMAHIDAQCRAEKKGPYLDPNDPEYASKRRETQCDILRLKPYDPLATPEGRFAHSIKLPPPHDNPKNVYRPGMTGEEYFKALCETEAGDFIFKTIENVAGIRQLRPTPLAAPGELGSYLIDEFPPNLFLAVSPKPEGYLVSPIARKYQFLEVAVGSRTTTSVGVNTPYWLYFQDSSANQGYPIYGVNEKPTSVPKSRYGYTWRGINYSNAREVGIVGGELIILDTTTNEVLAFRRYIRRLFFDPNYRDARSMKPMICVNQTQKDGFAFITEVLKPGIK